MMNDTTGGTSSFDGWCEEVASRFLQSAIILDDLAWLGTEPTAEDAVDPTSLRPLTLDDDATRTEPEHVRVSGPTADVEQRAGVSLSAKPLIDGFANLGIVCAVLRPSLDEIESGQWQDSGVVSAAKRADIVVLDWRLGGSYGTDTLAIMRNILEDDSRK